MKYRNILCGENNMGIQKSIENVEKISLSKMRNFISIITVYCVLFKCICCSSVVQYLPTMHDAVGSVASTKRNTKVDIYPMYESIARLFSFYECLCTWRMKMNVSQVLSGLGERGIVYSLHRKKWRNSAQNWAGWTCHSHQGETASWAWLGDSSV